MNSNNYVVTIYVKLKLRLESKCHQELMPFTQHQVALHQVLLMVARCNVDPLISGSSQANVFGVLDHFKWAIHCALERLNCLKA